MYDAIVIGAGVAAAPTAMLLARSEGCRVLLVDPTTASDLRATLTVRPGELAALAGWGVRPTVPAGAPDPAGAVTVRRAVLDGLLREAAMVAGVEVRLSTTVTELLWSEDRVIGVRGVDVDGGWFEELAPVVVDVDLLIGPEAAVVEAADRLLAV